MLCGPLDLTDESAAGSLLALSNLVASIPAVLGVKITAYLKVHYGGSIAFSVTAAVYIVAQSFYWTFGSAQKIKMGATPLSKRSSKSGADRFFSPVARWEDSRGSKSHKNPCTQRLDFNMI